LTSSEILVQFKPIAKQKSYINYLEAWPGKFRFYGSAPQLFEAVCYAP